MSTQINANGIYPIVDVKISFDTSLAKSELFSHITYLKIKKFIKH